MSTSYMERMVEDARKRRLKIVELRNKGLTFAEIGGVMKITKAGVWRIWNVAVQRGEAHAVGKD